MYFFIFFWGFFHFFIFFFLSRLISAKRQNPRTRVYFTISCPLFQYFFWKSFRSTKLGQISQSLGDISLLLHANWDYLTRPGHFSRSRVLKVIWRQNGENVVFFFWIFSFFFFFFSYQGSPRRIDKTLERAFILQSQVRIFNIHIEWVLDRLSWAKFHSR